jgi:hypothetical protein
MRRALFGTLLLALLGFASPVEAQPTVQGTGVDRNGIMHRPAPRVRTYTIPQGGYHYWGYYSSPGYFFYPGNVYYSDPYACPYCGSPWCYGNCWYSGQLYLPPIAGDASALFGNRAAQRFLGVGGGNNNQAAAPRRAAGGGGGAGGLLPEQAEDRPKVSNPTARAQAWKFVEYGDRQFKKGDYRQALARYEKAERQASDVADIYFRKAFAQVGMARYAEATESVKRGLQLKPSWPQSGFVLEELYPGAEAKRAIFRQLTVHLDAHPRDAEATFMLAVLQHFDGQEAAAEVKFRHVIDLLGQAEHARMFLPVDDPPAAAAGNADGARAAGNNATPAAPRGANQPPPAPVVPPANPPGGGGFGNLPPVENP